MVVLQKEGLVECEALTEEGVSDEKFRLYRFLHPPKAVAQMYQCTFPFGVPLDDNPVACRDLGGHERWCHHPMAALCRRDIAVVGHEGGPIGEADKLRQDRECAFSDGLIAVHISPDAFQSADAQCCLLRRRVYK